MRIRFGDDPFMMGLGVVAGTLDARWLRVLAPPDVASWRSERRPGPQRAPTLRLNLWIKKPPAFRLVVPWPHSRESVVRSKLGLFFQMKRKKGDLPGRYVPPHIRKWPNQPSEYLNVREYQERVEPDPSAVESVSRQGEFGFSTKADGTATHAMSELLRRLRPKERRGSKPRCHLLTHGSRDEIARRLSDLIGPWGTVSPEDTWMPEGFQDPEEAQLHTSFRLIASPQHRDALKKWWLADPRPTSRTPTWDIVSTCSIEGRQGLLLVEAKAHEAELANEECGKRRSKDSSEANHASIGRAIGEAAEGLRVASGLDWLLSSERCYQMSNRFAWAWKLCTLEYPLALVYLGFIGAVEMAKPFADATTWVDMVKAHSGCLFPSDVWNNKMIVNGNTFVPLIQARAAVPLPPVQ